MKLYLAAAAATLLAGSAAAQGTTPLRPEQRIKFIAPDAGFLHSVPATVIVSRSDSLLLRIHGMQQMVGTAAITELRISHGHPNRVRWGLIGGVGGGAVGLGAAKVMRDIWSGVDCGSRGCADDAGDADKVNLINIGVPLTTLVLGSLLGSLVLGERWEFVRISPAASPTAHGSAQLEVRIAH